MAKRYVLKLTGSERAELESVVRRGKATGWKIQRAQALLKCDPGTAGPSRTDEQVGEAFGCTTRSLQSCRKQAVEGGPLSLLERQPRSLPGPPRPPEDLAIDHAPQIGRVHCQPFLGGLLRHYYCDAA